MRAALLLVAALTAPAAAQDRPVVVAVNAPLAHFAERLAGDEAEVVMPVPEDRDPATWRPGVAEIGRVQSADLILLNGAGFAAWTERATLPRARTVDTGRALADALIETEAVTHSHGADGEHSHAATASFTWLDQEQAAVQARAVAEALERAGLVEPAEIEARLAALEADLAALDARAEALAPLAEDRVLIATHPRYQYLSRAYGLDVRALDWDAGAAPGPEQLDALAAMVAETGATVLMWEAEPPQEARRAVADLGLADVVFPTLASLPEGVEYGAAFGRAVDDLAAALRGLPDA